MLPSTAVPAAFPAFIAPCLPTLVLKVPSGPGWVHEIKCDGYRIQLHRRDGSTRALIRNGYDWTERLSALIAAMAACQAGS